MDEQIKIAPSILSADFSILGDEIKALDSSNCEYIHIDVMDGHFVPNITIGPDVVKSLRGYTKKTFDVHLMIDPVEKFLVPFINAGSDIITIHHEISENVFQCFETIKNNNKKVGISIKPSTPVNVLSKYLEYIDLILIMTVEPGFGGQKLMNDQIEKVKKTKELIGNRAIDIEVDGKVSLTDKMGLLTTVEDARKSLESIFKNNIDKPNNP